jgi:serine/threonine protein kinase
MLMVILNRVFGLPDEKGQHKKLDRRSGKLFKSFCKFEQLPQNDNSLRQLLLAISSELIFGFEGITARFEKKFKLSFLRFQLAALIESDEEFPDKAIFRTIVNHLREHVEQAVTMQASTELQNWLIRLLSGEQAVPLPSQRTHLYKLDLFASDEPIRKAATRIYDRLQKRHKLSLKRKTDVFDVKVARTAMRDTGSGRLARLASLTDSQRSPSALIGDYTVDREVGAGAVGKVFLAYDATGKKVAIKVLNPQFSSRIVDISRFGREVEITLALKHPHIAASYEYGTDRGRPFLVMEYLVGGTLEERLTEKKSLQEDEVWHIIRQLALALDYAWNHPKSFVHRDIKTANIMFDSQGMVKLTDFGLATGMTADATRYTMAGQTLGTPVYMSPEQLEDSSKVDIRSDLWGLGVVAYRALTGEFPFPGPGLSQLILQIFSIDPTLNPKFSKLSQGSQKILGRLLAKKVGPRFQLPWELVNEIDARPFTIDPQCPQMPLECPIVICFPGDHKLFLFQHAELPFGRKLTKSNALCLRPLDSNTDFRRLSGEHGRFHHSPDGFSVVDASSNGLFVNGRRVVESLAHVCWSLADSKRLE